MAASKDINADITDPTNPDHRSGADSAAGHHGAVAQPHTPDEGPVADAEAVAAQISTDADPMGRPGRPLDRRSPFLIGMAGAAGVVVTVALVDVIITARDVLILIGLALFIAVGLEPAVSWLARHRLPRWAAVTTVCVGFVAAIGGFIAAAIPPLVTQAGDLIAQAPALLQTLTDRSSLTGPPLAGRRRPLSSMHPRCHRSPPW